MQESLSIEGLSELTDARAVVDAHREELEIISIRMPENVPSDSEALTEELIWIAEQGIDLQLFFESFKTITNADYLQVLKKYG